ncbi:histone-lysine N-methyltransferase SETMAR [Plakobranchus ocellatus]|uniref:Histone-lysine N-methyltransferase SETMAR n=1 Tax=Plakobranchus ocellatus TaxID=259542 RepID=A0AAV4AMU6_9GAST|nr:histone-lysine N-methyltransferase SETMAR [Plakobranchus ocellatus]
MKTKGCCSSVMKILFFMLSMYFGFTCHLLENVDALSTTETFDPYTEFPEFTREQILDFEKIFKTYDIDNDKFIDQMELQLMMEKLGAPQTFLSLKGMIKEVDEDLDSKISFREFLLIFRKAAAGELGEGSGLSELSRLTEIDVDETGVGGAKDFFQAKCLDRKMQKRLSGPEPGNQVMAGSDV